MHDYDLTLTGGLAPTTQARVLSDRGAGTP